jgi:4-amino-4-deoxy-L-arabinose transferase-like glycosyltransferase
MKLNAGGIIAALLILGVAGAIAITHPTKSDEAIGYFVKATVTALIVSSVGATWLWSMFVSQKDTRKDGYSSSSDD